MASHEVTIDLSKLSLDDLKKISRTRGLPSNIVGDAEMLEIIREDAVLEPVSDALVSEEWTIPTSPRTKQRIDKLIGGKLQSLGS